MRQGPGVGFVEDEGVEELEGDVHGSRREGSDGVGECKTSCAEPQLLEMGKTAGCHLGYQMRSGSMRTPCCGPTRNQTANEQNYGRTCALGRGNGRSKHRKRVRGRT